MRELINDPFYELIEKYDRCIIDYCLIEDDTPHQGYRSHKDAVLFAMLPAAVAEDGVVTARAKGTAVITVSTFNGKRATVKIAVN